MELSVYNIKGEDTGRKVVLDDAIYGIEPNDHAIYLAVKQYMANRRQGTAKSKERSEISGSTRKLGRQKVVAVHAVVILIHRCWLVAHAFLVLNLAIMGSNSTRRLRILPVALHLATKQRKIQ